MISKKAFASHLNELLDVKGGFLGVFFLLFIFIEGITVYFSLGFEDWYTHLYFQILNIVLVLTSAIALSLLYVLVTLKGNLKTMFNYSFDQLIIYLKNEIGKSSRSNLTKATNRFLKDMAAPSIAAVIAIYIPVLGGFIVGWLTDRINSVFELVLITKTEYEVNGEEVSETDFGKYISSLENKKSKLVDISGSVLNWLIIPTLMLSILFGGVLFTFNYLVSL